MRTCPHSGFGQMANVWKPRRLSRRITWPPVVEGVGHRLAERRAQADRRRLLVAEVDQPDLGHRPVADAAREREPRVPAQLGVPPGLERGRRRAEDQRDARPPAPASRRRRARGSAGVVSCLNVLSCSSSITISPSFRVGAKIAERAPTTTWTSPAAMLRQWRCRSASLRWLWSTATRSNRRRNRRIVCGRQADLGDEHDRLAAPRDDALDRAQVDLGLAAAGDAVEQERLVWSSAVERRGEAVEDAALLGR